MLQSLTFVSKFWSHVDCIGPCWVWKHKTWSNGYGKFSPCSCVALRAHRVSFALANGKLPDDKNIVMHICDNRLCVNPDHLKEASIKDNNRDREQKGRGRKAGLVTACPCGHEYVTGTFWITKKGYKVCKICEKNRNYRRTLNYK